MWGLMNEYLLANDVSNVNRFWPGSSSTPSLDSIMTSLFNLMEARYFPNTHSQQGYLRLTDNPETSVQRALEQIVADVPPRAEYSHHHCHGLFSGPTALAFLFLRVGQVYPTMKIGAHSLRYWTNLYVSARRTGAPSSRSGLTSEIAGLGTVKTLLDRNCALVLLTDLEEIMRNTQNPHELLYGSAGLLYMIRLIESWHPILTSSFADIKQRIVDGIITAGPDWTWHEKRYIGVAHGDIGILTQLILTNPKLAERSFAKNKLDSLLILQRADGNWPAKEGEERRERHLMQICHGAPGFIVSLESLRQFFPNMAARIDEAITEGRKAIWEQGLLRKEPCLCHGILGNAL